MKSFWALRNDRKVTAFFYSIRGTETATTIHNAIKELQFKENPTEGCRQVIEIPDSWEFNAAGHWIGFRMVIESESIRVLYVTII